MSASLSLAHPVWFAGYKKLMMRTNVGVPMEADPEAAQAEEAKRAEAATLIQCDTRYKFSVFVSVTPLSVYPWSVEFAKLENG